MQRAFAVRFPGVAEIRWAKENESGFETEFKGNGREQSANFGIDGVWKETETKVMEADVPSNVLSTISAEFSGFRKLKSNVVLTARLMRVFYRSITCV